MVDLADLAIGCRVRVVVYHQTSVRQPLGEDVGTVIRLGAVSALVQFGTEVGLHPSKVSPWPRPDLQGLKAWWYLPEDVWPLSAIELLAELSSRG